MTNVTIHSCTFVGLNTGVSLYSSYSLRTSSLLITQSSFINNNRTTWSWSGGGAIYVRNRMETSITIDRCIFAGNTAYQGGAIYLQNSETQPLNCIIYGSIFVNNNATFRGGAISAAGNANVSIVDSIFGYNTAPQCAVFSNEISTSSNLFESTIFLYNQATNSTAEEDDNIQYLGGVACIRHTSLVVNNCTFSHNTAKDDGGVLHAEDSSVTISSSSFHNNSAGIDGGVLYTYLLPSTHYVLQRCSFTNNRAGDDGGAIYIGKTRSTLDVGRSFFSHNVANDRGGAIIVFGSTIGMERTDMHSNEAASGDDIGMCTASNITGPSTYFTYFQQRTSSTPTTDSECLFYGRLTRFFHNPTPEDHSNISLAQYLVLSNVSSDHNNLPMTTTGTTDVDTTNPERVLLEDLRNKITKTSSVQYVIFAISLLFVIVLVIAILMKFKTVCLKKKARATECYDLDKCNTGDNNHNESPKIILYEEPVWKDDRSDAIKMKPNSVYAKH